MDKKNISGKKFENFKLFHLPYIMGDTDKVKQLMEIMYDFSHRNFFWKVLRSKHIVEAIMTTRTRLVSEMATMSNPEYKPDIDGISYLGRRVIEGKLTTGFEDYEKYLENVLDVLAIVTFENKYKEPFNKHSRFPLHQSSIKYLSIDKAIGDFNTVCKLIVDSTKVWGEKLQSQQYTDPDFEEAGGEQLDPFSTINIISGVCNTFNLDYDGAWNLPYAVVQTYLLGNLTSDNVHRRLQKIKEDNIKAKRTA